MKPVYDQANLVTSSNILSITWLLETGTKLGSLKGPWVIASLSTGAMYLNHNYIYTLPIWQGHGNLMVISCNFLIMKPIRCTNYTNLFLEWNSMFQTAPLSIIGFSLYTAMVHVIQVCWQLASRIWVDSILILLANCQQNLYDIYHAACTVKNSWWWAEELSETWSFISRINLRN